MSMDYSVYIGPCIIIKPNDLDTDIMEITNETFFQARKEIDPIGCSLYIIPNRSNIGYHMSEYKAYEKPCILSCCVNNLREFEKEFQKEIEILKNIFGEDTISIQTMIVQDIY